MDNPNINTTVLVWTNEIYDYENVVSTYFDEYDRDVPGWSYISPPDRDWTDRDPCRRDREPVVGLWSRWSWDSSVFDPASLDVL